MIENKEYFSIGLLKEAIEIQDFELWEIVMGIFHYLFLHFKDQTMNRGATIISRLMDD